MRKTVNGISREEEYEIGKQRRQKHEKERERERKRTGKRERQRIFKLYDNEVKL